MEGIEQSVEEKALAEVAEERTRQTQFWGVQRMPSGEWLAVLIEELGEVGAALQTAVREKRAVHNMMSVSPSEPALLAHISERTKAVSKVEEELVQVAAVAVQMVEALRTGGVTDV